MTQTNTGKRNKRPFILAAILGVAIIGGAGFIAAEGMFHSPMMSVMHGHDGEGHDMTNMPGLRGANATELESAELAILFNGFGSITREVTNLPDGIRTVTRSSDDIVMDNLVSHVVGMIGRVADLDDPEIFIQSPTLDIFFVRGEGITSDIEVTEEGIIVTQISADPEVVAALQTHAAEVSEMADRGMAAVHDMMMVRGSN